MSSQSQPAAENNAFFCSEVCIKFSPHPLGCIYTACTFRPGRTDRLGWGHSRHSRSLNQRWMYKSNRFQIVLSDQETNEFAFFGKRLIMMTHCNQVKTQLVVSVSSYYETHPSPCGRHLHCLHSWSRGQNSSALGAVSSQSQPVTCHVISLTRHNPD